MKYDYRRYLFEHLKSYLNYNDIQCMSIINDLDKILNEYTIIFGGIEDIQGSKYIEFVPVFDNETERIEINNIKIGYDNKVEDIKIFIDGHFYQDVKSQIHILYQMIGDSLTIHSSIVIDDNNLSENDCGIYYIDTDYNDSDDSYILYYDKVVLENIKEYCKRKNISVLELISYCDNNLSKMGLEPDCKVKSSYFLGTQNIYNQIISKIVNCDGRQVVPWNAILLTNENQSAAEVIGKVLCNNKENFLSWKDEIINQNKKSNT